MVIIGENLSVELSQKLSKYMNKIENETGRKIVIEGTDDVGLASMSAVFKEDPRGILVQIALDRHDRQITDQEVEQSLAHEITHGLLLYKQGYCGHFFKRPANNDEKKIVSILITMIDDIVVNKIIHENGFYPFSPIYLPMVKRETTAALRGRDIYNQISNDSLLKNRFIVFRYIMAWGFLKYFDLELNERKIIYRFLKSIQKSYPEQYKMAKQIEDIILQNDIFTPAGHHNTIEKILSLWSLEDLVELEIKKD